MNVECLKKGIFNNKGYILDDCTNIHYLDDFKIAENNLKLLNN